MSRGARTDIQNAVAFLTTRVQCPDVDDISKLKRVLQYPRNTAEFVLTLETDSLVNIKWFADSSFGVHFDGKSHTGSLITLGGGALLCFEKTKNQRTKFNRGGACSCT